MLFNSVFFITIFLPLALAGWFLLQKLENPLYGKLFLTGMSLWFYGYYNLSYLWILLFSLTLNFGLSLLFEGVSPGGGRRLLFTLGIVGNLGLLFYFKYFHFFLDNCNFFLHTDITIERIALPLGISFFTFQQLSFLIERYKGVVPHYRLADYCCFITFFPQLIAGPIVLHDEFLPQLLERKNRRIQADSFFDGLSLFILGFAKKALLADSLAVLVNAEYSNIAYLDMPGAWATIICYMLELYFDFSGYCDMARGIGKMFGFVLPENFDSPLMAVSVKDFWRRWHKTLSRFLSRYIYIPLGGNRRGKIRQCLNLMTVFLVSGLWHGAAWTFVFWGLMHGLAMVWETLFPRLRFQSDWANRMVTGIFVTLSFSVFRSDSLGQAGQLWQKLFAGGLQGRLAGVCNVLQFSETYVLRELLERAAPQALNVFYIGTLVLLWFISLILLRGPKAEQWIENRGGSVGGVFVLATLFVWSFLSLSQVSTFLYFNF
ncbi:MAG: MBOAT family protein [Roseburia sp.]|nr:MBOAT family protein [Roseburia sp.]